MKKVLQSFFSVVLAILMFSSQAVAYSNSTTAINTQSEIDAVVDFDEASIYDAFNEVGELVATLENNNDITYSELEASKSEMIANVSSSAAIAMSSSDYDSPPFLSAFLWGCLFNLAGVLIVGVTTDFDNDQFRKSAWGCLFNSLLGYGFWGILGGS